MSSTNEIAQIDQINKALTSLNSTLDQTSAKYLTIVKNINDSQATVKLTVQTQENLNKAQKETADTTQKLDSLGKQLQASEQKLKQTEDERLKTIIQNRIATAEATKAVTDKVKAEGLAETSLVRMRQKLAEMTAEYDKSAVRTKAAANEINKLSLEIENSEKATNRHGRGVGEYRNKIGELANGLANGTLTIGQFTTGIIASGKAMLAWFLSPVGMIIGAVAGLIMAGKAMINNAQDFQRAASSLSSITGAVGKDLDFMKQKAREFARDSEASATEILVAFEKVGSKLPELLKNGPLLAEVSRNAIILSESTQGKLSIEDAAVATSAVLNAFNIKLTDSQRAINALSAASLEGGAEVMDLVDSFKNLAPVAVISNVILEEPAAALEVLEKNQLKAEKGGMQLKGALLEMQQAGVGFVSGQFNINDALEEADQRISSIEDPLKRSAEQTRIFGRENITAGLVLVENRQKFADLTVTLEEHVKKGTIASDMARTATDNLEGSYKKVSNAWEGLLLQFEDGSGIIMGIWRGLVDFTTMFLNGLNDDIALVTKFFDLFRSNQAIMERESKKQTLESKKEKKEQAKEAEEYVKTLDEQLRKEILLIRQQGREKKQNQDDTNKVIMGKELEFYQKQLDARKKAGLDTLQIEEKIEGVLAMQSSDKEESEKKAEKAQRKAQELREKQFKSIEIANEKEIIAINKKLINGAISEEQHKKLLEDLELKFLIKKQAIYAKDSKEWADIELQKQNIAIKSKQEILKEKEKVLKEEEKLADEGMKDFENSQKEQNKTEEQFINESLKNGKEVWNEKKKLDDDEKKRKTENAKAIRDIQIQMGRDVVNAVFEANNQKFASELDQLNKEKEAKLKNTHLTAAQKASIEAEFAKKEAAVKTKQAQSDKTKAIFDIAINTAVAVMANAKNPVLIPWVIALGVLEAALVAARPIPKFATGTKDAPRRGIFGEAGVEVMFPKSGGAIFADKPTYFEGDKFKGAEIYSNAETKKLMSLVGDRNIIVKNQHDPKLLDQMKRIEKAIVSKPIAIYDNDHRQIGLGNSVHQTIYLDRLLRK